MDALLQDLRYAARGFRQAPAFTLAATLTLTLGIGTNIAIFSAMYGVLGSPLPYRDPDRLAVVRATTEYEGTHRPQPFLILPHQFALWQKPLPAIESMALYAPGVHALSGPNGAELLDSAVVSGSFFSTLGARFAAGRALESSDDLSALVVISERLARRLFVEPRSAIGRDLVLSFHPYTIVGVASPDVQIPSSHTDLWLPAGFSRTVNERCCGFQSIARLAPGGSVERARESAAAVFESSEEGRQPGSQVAVTATLLRDDMVEGIRPALLMLYGSVSIVLVIACINLVNLLLARNVARDREFAVRRALGASRTRLMRQVLVESSLLAAAGTLFGLALAGPSVAALARMSADTVPRVDAIHLDATVVLFAVVLCGLVTIATGIIPALKVGADDALAQRSATVTAGASARRLHRTLCVAQVAMAVVLLVGAMLLARSLVSLLRTDLGVSTDHVLTASLNLGMAQRPPDAETLTRIKRVVDAVQALPGTRSVGIGSSLPPANSRIRLTLRRPGETVGYAASAVPVTPGYFSALQMRLVRGRFFTDADDGNHPQVMIMNEDTARRFFGNGDPIGKSMNLPVIRDGKTTSIPMTLIGVVANVKYSGLAAPADDALYRPFEQQPWMAPFIVVRTAGDPRDLSLTLRRAIAAADSGIVTASIMTLDEIVSNAASQPQFRTMLLVSLAGLALAIAAVGLYGVVAYAVSRRTREIGIRMALGASTTRVLRMVLNEGMMMAVAGIGLGLAGALALSRLLAGLLYGIAPTDPASFLIAAATLLAVTFAAAYAPARRAARVNPIETLRVE